MGSKAKYAGSIVPILQKMIEDNNIKTYIEPFCGGCSIIERIKCDKKLAYDKSETLIALLKQIQEDITKLPKDGNRRMWDEGKAYVKDGTPLTTMTLAEVGAIEFFASFSNGGFPRGYAKNTETRNYYQEAWRNHNKQKDLESYNKIHFLNNDYRDIDLNKFDLNTTVLYCDSPYKGTKPYAIDRKFDFDSYYNWLRETSKKVPIFSEQNMPDDFPIIWEKEAKRTAGKDNNFKACEKLYLIDNRGE